MVRPMSKEYTKWRCALSMEDTTGERPIKETVLILVRFFSQDSLLTPPFSAPGCQLARRPSKQGPRHPALVALPTLERRGGQCCLRRLRRGVATLDGNRRRCLEGPGLGTSVRGSRGTLLGLEAGNLSLETSWILPEAFLGTIRKFLEDFVNGW